jgi:hypothetical protein
MPIASGTRLRCESCGTEIIILKSSDPMLECCGEAMELLFLPPAKHGSSDSKETTP